MTARKRDAHTGSSAEDIRRDFLDNLLYQQGRFPKIATCNDHYRALAYTVRDRVLARWSRAGQTFLDTGARTVAYLSAEFLLGPHLANTMMSLDIGEPARKAMSDLGLDVQTFIDHEEEPGLGNGGLGRLAACYLDSLATLEIPAFGYGIRYEFGIFDQEIRDGWQVEVTDKWLRLGNPWEIARPEIAYDIKLGGRTEAFHDDDGRYRVRWVPDRVVRGVAYDTLILGYRVNTVNLLRLWSAQATESFDFQAFNVGDYVGAVEQKIASETISKVLYPNDSSARGKALRLMQQYFFVTCSLQDMIRLHLQKQPSVLGLEEKWVAQLNDTHPSIAVAELMRLLLDEHGLAWEQAWEMTRKVFAYTNHTLMPEALEKWPLHLFQRHLPRHLEIIYEINQRFLAEVRGRRPGDEALVARVSLIDEAGERYVRMANLACVGSFSINGVARLHTELLQREVLADFHALWPERFNNKTNGVTPRRFVRLANPRLAALLDARLGERWTTHLEELVGLEPLAEDAAFQEKWRQVKRRNKEDLARILADRVGVVADPDSLFDVQVKRIHEYKRQHLNVLHVIALYLRLGREPKARVPARTVILGGKAAPGYAMAKLMIKLVHAVAAVVNADPVVGNRLKVAFLPDYNVKRAQRVFPAADLSEQISTAGKEASGTGNMKFSLNGALTIGTLDGANIEIRERVGAENFFVFGLKVEEVQARRARGYRPQEEIDRSPRLREVLELLDSGAFSAGNRQLFRPLLDHLRHHDEYFLLADFESYLEAQRRVEEAYLEPRRWTAMAIRNVARMGYFSSDRAIREYAEEIWRVKPVPVQLADDPAAG